MYPKLFHVSFLNTYGLLVGIGIIAALFLFRKLSQKLNMSEASFKFYGIVLVVSIALAFVFARLFQMIYNLAKTGEIGSGITFLGGLIGGVAVFFVAVLAFGKKYRSDLMKTVNIAMPCITLGHFFGRLGCFFAGCCYGKETDSFLGVKFVQYITSEGKWVYGPPRLPTQLFEALFLLLLTAFLLFLIFRLHKLDFAAVAYLYGYGVFRFLIEFIRDDERGAFLLGLSPSQVISIIMVLGATALMVYLLLKKKRSPLPEGANSASDNGADGGDGHEPEISDFEGKSDNFDGDPGMMFDDDEISNFDGEFEESKDDDEIGRMDKGSKDDFEGFKDKGSKDEFEGFKDSIMFDDDEISNFNGEFEQSKDDIDGNKDKFEGRKGE